MGRLRKERASQYGDVLGWQCSSMRAGADIPVPTHADIDVSNGGAGEERELFRARHQRRAAPSSARNEPFWTGVHQGRLPPAVPRRSCRA